MVSYADFITLMFAVFTVLYATSNQDVEKAKEFQQSIQRYLIKAGAFGGSGEKINQGEKYNNPIEPPIQTYNQVNPLTQETFDEAEKYIEDELSEAERSKYVYDISLDDLGVRMILAAPQIYAPDSVKFQEGALPFLEKLGGFLTKIGRRVLVEGHSAKERTSQLFPSAWEFAGARATALVRYMVKRHKMAPDLFTPVTYGASRPLSSTKRKSIGEGNRSQNERVEMVILTEDLPF